MSDVPPAQPAVPQNTAPQDTAPQDTAPQDTAPPTPYPGGYAPPAWSPYEYAVHGAAGSVPLPRRRRVGRTLLLVAPSAVLLVGVGVVATVLVDHHGSAGTGAAGAAPAGGAQAGGGTGARKAAAHPVTGVVTAEQGSTWSVRTSSGSVLSVQVGAHTRFGTRADPSSAGAIPTGSTVAVTGSTSGTTVHATRIRPADATPPTPSRPVTPSPAPSSSATTPGTSAG